MDKDNEQAPASPGIILPGEAAADVGPTRLYKWRCPIDPATRRMDAAAFILALNQAYELPPNYRGQHLFDLCRELAEQAQAAGVAARELTLYADSAAWGAASADVRDALLTHFLGRLMMQIARDLTAQAMKQAAAQQAATKGTGAGRG